MVQQAYPPVKGSSWDGMSIDLLMQKVGEVCKARTWSSVMFEKCVAQWVASNMLIAWRSLISTFREVLIKTVNHVLRQFFRMQTLTFSGRSGYSSSFLYWEHYISLWAVLHDCLDWTGLCYQGTRSDSVSLIIWITHLLACFTQLSPRQGCSRGPCARQCGHCPSYLAQGSEAWSLGLFYFSSIDMDYFQSIYHGS